MLIIDDKKLWRNNKYYDYELIAPNMLIYDQGMLILNSDKAQIIELLPLKEGLSYECLMAQIFKKKKEETGIERAKQKLISKDKWTFFN